MVSTKRKLRALATRERILSVAMTMMQTQSLEEIRVGDICKMAGIGTGTFYHHYKSKNDIALAVYGEMDAHFLQLAADPGVAAMTAYQYVIRHFLCYARFMSQKKANFSRKVYAMQSKTFLDRGRPLFTTLRGVLEQKRSDGVIPLEADLDRLCEYINLSLRAISYDWCLHDGEYDLLEATLRYAADVMAGYEDMLAAGYRESGRIVPKNIRSTDSDYFPKLL